MKKLFLSFILFFGLLQFTQAQPVPIGATDTLWTRYTQLDNGIYQVEFAPDSKYLLAVGEKFGDPIIKGMVIYDMLGEEIKSFFAEGLPMKKDGEGIWDAHYSKDGQYLYAIWEYDDLFRHRINIYRNEIWQLYKTYDLPEKYGGASVIMSPNNNIIVGMISDGFYFFDMNTQSLLKHVDDYGQDKSKGITVYTAKYTPDGNYIIFTATDGKLRFLNTTTYNIDYTYDNGYGELAISNDGSMLAYKTGVLGQAVQIMNTQTKEIMKVIPVPPNIASCLAFSIDNKYLGIGYDFANQIIFWSLDSVLQKFILNQIGGSTISISKSDSFFAANSAQKLFLFKTPWNITSVKSGFDSINTIFPNPADNTIIIQFFLPSAGITKINLYSINGNNIKTLIEGFLEGGEQKIKLNVADLPSGTYMVQVSAKDFSKIFKLIINK